LLCASTAGSRPPLSALLEREVARDALFAARAGEPRRHKTVRPATRALLDSVAASHLAGSGLPQSFLDSLVESKAAQTWDRYAGVIQPWFDHAADLGVPPLPAPGGPFAAWLYAAGTRDRGYSQTKTRCNAIAALSALVGADSPTTDHRVALIRVVACRGKRYRRGRARPVLRADIPIVQPLTPPESPPRGSPVRLRRGRRSGPSPNTARRRGAATAAHMAVLHDAVLRYDDTREGELRDIAHYPDAVDIGIFGSKTDPLLSGQTAQMPPSTAGVPGLASGAAAILTTVGHGLRRLAALPDETLAPLARRLAAVFPADVPDPDALSAWPADVSSVASALAHRGLLVHRLPYYGPWLWEPLSAELDLSRTLSTGQFGSLARSTLLTAGSASAVSGVGAHSFRRGGAATYSDGGMPLDTLTLALRHASARSTVPYVFQSVHVANTAGAMRAVAGRSRGRERAARGLPPELVPAPRPPAPSRGYRPPHGLRGRPFLDY
jgi:hypothetical protein